MNFVLGATALIAACLAPTSAQPQSPAAPETILLRDWFSFGVGSNYHTWRHGFPAGTTPARLVPGHGDVDGFLHEQLYDEARGHVGDFWTYLSYAHAECELNSDAEEISLAYIFYVCREKNGSHVFCPKPCGARPCPPNADCHQTLSGLFDDNYRCTCHAGYAWDSVQRDCVTSGGGNPNITAVSPAANATTAGTNFTTVSGGGGGGIQPFSYQSSALPTTSTDTPQSTIQPPLTWDNFTKLYSDWRLGFPPGTTLSSVLPGVIDPDDVLDTLYHRQAQADPGEFWRHLLAASAVGDVTSDLQLLSLAYIYYLCRETLGQNSECPDPCGAAPCAGRTCTVTGTGLFRDEYQCNCAEHYHWDPLLARCVFCAPGTAWSAVYQQCVHVAATSLAPPTRGGGGGVQVASWSAWSSWSACSSECEPGTRARRRVCHDGPCEGNRHAQEACQGGGFWQCDGMLVVGGAAAMALLLLVAGVIIFVMARRGEEQEVVRKLSAAESQRVRQQRPTSRRRAIVPPNARRPTRPRSIRPDRPAQRPRAGSRRPLTTRDSDRRWDDRDYPSDTDRRWDDRDYLSDTDRQWDGRNYPSSTTNSQWGPRDYPLNDDRQMEAARDYPPDNDRQWGQVDYYPDQTDRYSHRSYNEYPQGDQPASYDPYRDHRRQTGYY